MATQFYMRCCLGENCRNYFQQQLETLVGQPTLMDYISTYQVSFVYRESILHLQENN